jgi:hypothetical protein
MMYFENYRWEDHVPHKGSWKFNLAVGALAFGLIATVLPDRPDDIASLVNGPAKSTSDVRLSALDTPQRDVPAAFMGAADRGVQCPIAQADS